MHRPTTTLALVLAAACGTSPPTSPDPESPGIAASLSRGQAPTGGDVYGLFDRHGRRGCERSAGASQFDFWVGRWAITRPSGDPAGVSRITRELNGCAVFEFFTGGMGRSLSRYDRGTNRWTQDYVDNTGFTLRLAGGLDDTGVMRLEDEIRAIPGGPALKSAFTWTPNPDGTVRQVWRFSLDGGATSIINFNGLYANNPGYVDPPPPAPGACQTRPAQRTADGFLGSWQIRTSRGRKVGHATLTLEAASCLIEERFTGPDRFEHRAFVYFDRFVGQWFRMHADNRGGGYRLNGTMAGSAMTLVGNDGDDGRPVRLTWTLDEPDRATQVWEAQGRDGSWRPITTLIWRRTGSHR